MLTLINGFSNKHILKCAYKADFTVHGKKYYDGDDAEVETYLSIVM